METVTVPSPDPKITFGSSVDRDRTVIDGVEAGHYATESLPHESACGLAPGETPPRCRVMSHPITVRGPGVRRFRSSI